MHSWGWHFEWLFSAKLIATVGALIAVDAVLLFLGNRKTRVLSGGR